MRALVMPRARQIVRDEDGGDQPPEYHDLDFLGRSTKRKIKRKRCKRGKAAQEPRPDEGAMAGFRHQIQPR
jgi:hypothetical protein